MKKDVNAALAAATSAIEYARAGREEAYQQQLDFAAESAAYLTSLDVRAEVARMGTVDQSGRTIASRTAIFLEQRAAVLSGSAGSSGSGFNDYGFFDSYVYYVFNSNENPVDFADRILNVGVLAGRELAMLGAVGAVVVVATPFVVGAAAGAGTVGSVGLFIGGGGLLALLAYDVYDTAEQYTRWNELTTLQQDELLAHTGVLIVGFLLPGYEGRGLRPRSTPRSVEPRAAATVFRVQGGVLPNASKIRFVLDDAGRIATIRGDDMLFINVNQKTRALEFLAKRGEGANLVQFQIKPEL